MRTGIRSISQFENAHKMGIIAERLGFVKDDIERTTDGSIGANCFAYTTPAAFIASDENHCVMDNSQSVLLTDAYTQPTSGALFFIYLRDWHSFHLVKHNILYLTSIL
jgi:hypothetical protein